MHVMLLSQMIEEDHITSGDLYMGWEGDLDIRKGRKALLTEGSYSYGHECKRKHFKGRES